MKNIKFLMYGFLAIFMAACSQTVDNPFPEFDDMEKGAYARKTDGVNGVFDFFDVDGSEIDFTVELYDENQGKNITNYDWTVKYVSGDGEVGPVAFKSFSASDFSPNSGGLPGMTINFGFSETLAALGLTNADIDGGNYFLYQATITKANGAKFSSTNTGGNIVGSAPFSGLFTIRQNIICPSDLTGKFDVVATGWCGTEYTGVYEFISDGVGVYKIWDVDNDVEEFSLGAYYACYGSDPQGGGLPFGDLRLVDACGVLSHTGASQWGEAYYFDNITVDGPTMTFEWHNDYAPEAGTSILTRQDGADWPPLSF